MTQHPRNNDEQRLQNVEQINNVNNRALAELAVLKLMGLV